MPSPYRLRPTEVKQCDHCSRSFETKYERTRFCSNTCRTKAFYARHGRQLPTVQLQGVEHNQTDQVAAPKPEKTGFPFLDTLATLLAADAVKEVGKAAFLDRQPTSQDVLDRVGELDKDLETGLNQLNRGIQYTVDWINALRASNPDAAQEKAYERILEDRLLEQARLMNRQDIVEQITAKREAENRIKGR